MPGSGCLGRSADCSLNISWLPSSSFSRCATQWLVIIGIILLGLWLPWFKSPTKLSNENMVSAHIRPLGISWDCLVDRYGLYDCLQVRGAYLGEHIFGFMLGGSLHDSDCSPSSLTSVTSSELWEEVCQSLPHNILKQVVRCHTQECLYFQVWCCGGWVGINLSFASCSTVASTALSTRTSELPFSPGISNACYK